MSTATLFKNKRIVLGVTGSIAVYKAVDLASKLTQAGALVDVIMTEAAQKFVTPLTFQAMTGRAVYTHLWKTDVSGHLPTHITQVGLGEGAHLLVIAPATAHTLAKLAHGFADDLLTVTALAARCPLMIAPAMDGVMYEHPAVQANLKTLIDRGATLIPPERGRFASGLEGVGRLPETATLMGAIRQYFARAEGNLKGRRVIVTAGGTQEPIDPVRYITNRSSGKQGYAIAQAAADAGADVLLITSATLPAPFGVEVLPVGSASEMLLAVLEQTITADVLVMAAAVADFRAQHVAQHKIKKQDDSDGLTLELARNPDILAEVAHVKTLNPQRGPRITVGFAAESQDLLENAQKKLERKNLDLMVANDISADDAGFAVDTNRVVLLSRDGQRDDLPLMDKSEVAEHIIARLVALLDG